MAGKLRAFARELQLLPQRMMSEDEFRKIHARIAREENAKIQDEYSPSQTTRFVDGRHGADEDSVKFGGVIVYKYSYVHRVALAAIAELWTAAAKFRDSGKYGAGFFFIADDKRVTTIPENAVEIYISNDVDYARKLHVRHYGFNAPPGIWEVVRQRLIARFGNTVRIDIRFLPLSGAYVLKTGKRRGQPITYPSLYIRPF